jgi:hypothetical protein
MSEIYFVYFYLCIPVAYALLMIGIEAYARLNGDRWV